MLRQSKERKIRCNVMGQTAEPHKTFEYYVRGHCTAVALSSVEQRSTMLPVFTIIPVYPAPDDGSYKCTKFLLCEVANVIQKRLCVYYKI